MKNKDVVDLDKDFDFGFSVVDEEVVAGPAMDKAQQIYNAVLPLLNNLEANPEREYIHWPNRTEKIKAFKQKLYDIIN